MAFSGKFSALATASAVVILLGSGVSAAPLQCNMSKASMINAAGRSTTSMDFVHLATVNFRQGGSAAACVVVQFSAQANADGGFLQIGVLLDDILQTTMNFADTGAASHSVMFPIGSVFPGTHSAKISMRSVSGTTVNIQSFTLAVFHVP